MRPDKPANMLNSSSVKKLNANETTEIASDKLPKVISIPPFFGSLIYRSPKMPADRLSAADHVMTAATIIKRSS